MKLFVEKEITRNEKPWRFTAAGLLYNTVSNNDIIYVISSCFSRFFGFVILAN